MYPDLFLSAEKATSMFRRFDFKYVYLYSRCGSRYMRRILFVSCNICPIGITGWWGLEMIGMHASHIQLYTYQNNTEDTCSDTTVVHL